METQPAGEPQAPYFGDGLKAAEATAAPEEGDAPEKEDAEIKSIFNHANKEKTVGPSATLTLQQAVAIAATPRSYLADRVTPPLTVVNARVYCGDEFVFEGDIVVPECAPRLHRVARGFEVTLELRYQTGDAVLWSSETPNMWLVPTPTPIPDIVARTTPSVQSKAKVTPLRAVTAPKPKAKAKAKAKPKAKAKVAAKGKKPKTVSANGKRIGRPPGSKDKKPRKKPGTLKKKAPARKAASVKKKKSKR